MPPYYCTLESWATHQMGDLAARQAALEGHFKELASARADRRVFALEHGLDKADRATLAQQIRAHCAQRPPSEDHWLLWTVYAAELGYDYAGREYWQSFEKVTPGWQPRGERGWIRECFHRFAQTYSGFRPEGSWAEHFSIICWPIVHAVLPRDLQVRIARILYDIRHSFTGETLSDPAALGALIATRGWLGSTRLEQLADDAKVIGTIALALLFRESKQHASVALLESTVARIADDLDQHRSAQAWLKDARGAASRVAMRGLRAVPARVAAKPTTPAEARRVLDELGVQPSVFLAPSPDGWLVMLRPPSLAPLLTRFPELREYLTRARPTVVGSSGELLARQRVLQGGVQVRLRTWPEKREVLLKFEDAPELLQVLLCAECLLRPGPTWLFRIGSDKVAYELKGRMVGAEKGYLLLTSAPPPGGLDLVPETLACEGMSAYRLRLPSSIDDEMAAALRALNLSVARAIEVRPAGLAAAGWDGNGFGEWLAGERPCVVVSSDHELESITCRLAGAEPLSIRGEALKGHTVAFVQFPQLAVGAHIAEFTLRTRTGGEQRGEMEMLVRERRHWAPGLTHDGALTVVADPPSPTIEELWSDRLTVDIHGPKGQSVECTVRFWRRPGRQALLEKRLDALPLPVTRHQWSTHFRNGCRTETESQGAYDQADGITLDFVSLGVGRFTLSAEREFVPLRWVVRYKNQRYHLRLQDDRGVQNTPRLVRYSFEQPAVAQTLPSKDLAGDGAEVDGGLHVALADEQSQAIIVAQRQFGLQDLRQHVRVPQVDPSADAIIPFLGIIELWSRARQVGSSFSLHFAVPSVRALMNALYGALGGEAWGQLETGSLQDLRSAIEHDGLGSEISDYWAEYARIPLHHRVSRFEKALIDEGVIPPGRRIPADPRERLAEVALRFASDPGGVRAWADGSKRLQGMINLLLHNRAAARAARFLVLCIETHLSPAKDTKWAIRYAGWEWS